MIARFLDGGKVGCHRRVWIAELERKVGQQELELDFFDEALRRIRVGGKRSAR
jgi:hypothetical protein